MKAKAYLLLLAQISVCGILRSSYGKETRSAKPILAAGRETEHQNVEGGGRKVERDPFFAGGPADSHNFDMRSGVRSAVMALILCLMVGVSTLKGQSLCVSLETPSHRVKL